jgi:sorbitol/mannitol transport system substrate-binding protein
MQRKSYVLTVVLCLGLLFMAGTQVFAEVTINIALANNPISQAMERIAREKYSAEGVTVNIAVLPENDLRQRLTTEASTGGTTYDMFYIGPYEAANWARFGWLENLEPYFAALSPEKLEWYIATI